MQRYSEFAFAAVRLTPTLLRIRYDSIRYNPIARVRDVKDKGLRGLL